jgi:hypothetical protein
MDWKRKKEKGKEREREGTTDQLKYNEREREKKLFFSSSSFKSSNATKASHCDRFLSLTGPLFAVANPREPTMADETRRANMLCLSF